MKVRECKLLTFSSLSQLSRGEKIIIIIIVMVLFCFSTGLLGTVMKFKDSRK